jgi:hypothetical protein
MAGLTKADKAAIARALGKLGGAARAKKLTATRRLEISRMGVEARRAKKEARQ